MFGDDNLLIVYGALFIGILLLVEGVYQITVDHRTGPRAQINRRLKMLESGSDPKQVLQMLRRRPRVSANALAKLVTRLDHSITQAGLAISVSRLLIWQGGLAAVIGAGLILATPIPTLAAVAFALLVAGAGPLLYIQSRKKRRLRMFAEQLPAALDLLVRSLRIGHPLSSALGTVAQELADPIGSEFGIVVDEITYGMDLQEAVEHMGDRIDSPDLRYMTVAINIQYNTGGNLAEILSGLSKVIRDRFQMFRKIQAVSAEGRMSAVFLSSFPFILGGLLWTINPIYYQQVSDDPLFSFLATTTIVLLIINIFVMRWLINFRI